MDSLDSHMIVCLVQVALLFVIMVCCLVGVSAGKSAMSNPLNLGLAEGSLTSGADVRFQDVSGSTGPQSNPSLASRRSGFIGDGQNESPSFWESGDMRSVVAEQAGAAADMKAEMKSAMSNPSGVVSLEHGLSPY